MQLILQENRLIGALLSDRLRENEKLDIIEKEYKIPLSNDFRKEVDAMCNLGQGIEDRVTAEVSARTIESVIIKMYQKGYTLEQISEIAEKSVSEIEEIIDKNSVLA